MGPCFVCRESINFADLIFLPLQESPVFTRNSAAECHVCTGAGIHLRCMNEVDKREWDTNKVWRCPICRGSHLFLPFSQNMNRMHPILIEFSPRTDSTRNINRPPRAAGRNNSGQTVLNLLHYIESAIRGTSQVRNPSFPM